MDIGFAEEHDLLRASARRFLENECPSPLVRQRMAELAAITDAFWQRLADQGWLGILYPEETGGSGPSGRNGCRASPRVPPRSASPGPNPTRWDAASIMAAGRETAGGSKLFVPNVHLSDALVVAVRTQDGSMMENGVSLFLVTKDAADLTVTSPGSTTRSSTSRLQGLRGRLRRRDLAPRARRSTADCLAGHQRDGRGQAQ
jgi:alkylation response protein AidB-like acyl-CoA dehydrogenase